MKLKTLLTSLGLGAGLMYFYDPQRGDRRRARVRDQVNRLANDIDGSLDVAKRDLRNRVRGTLAEATARLEEQGAPDWILEERVRARLGRLARHAGGLEVHAGGGRVTLSGPALREDVDALLKTAARTRGVHGVENQLQVYDSLQDLPSLPGRRTRQGPRPEWQQRTWSPGMRLAAGAGGGLLALYGLTRRGIIGTGLSAAGLVMTARSVTNLDTRSLLGLGLGENAIQVNKAININAPIDEVYRFWSKYENFPLFMNHVKSIQTQNGNSTWKVMGPAGAEVEFQARTVRNIPNEIIAWETQPDSHVHHTGFVRFDENPDGSTRVTVQMRYVPPAGAAGHAIAKLFGVDPRQAMHADLMRLKSLLEDGKTSTGETRVEYESL